MPCFNKFAINKINNEKNVYYYCLSNLYFVYINNWLDDNRFKIVYKFGYGIILII